MDRLRNYNLISQRFVTKYDDIPFIETNYKKDIKYNVSIEVFNTNYTKSYFKNFDVSNLYAIYIKDEDDDSSYFNLKIISKHKNYGRDIVVVKTESSFFMNIEYNNRAEISKPFFFRSDNFEESRIKEIINNALYEKVIIKLHLRKSIIKIDSLKLLENAEISEVVDFYINRTEAHLEDILKLRQDVLDLEEEYISKVEISIY
ncbi:hypothetical protein [Flavobacterium sp. PL02]|uniref:hypothetical protein n=1 Tax=Flavobacterium sp. PL02 TaxID=3088354 RepID=UPI002B22B849|nr:hypothetical protein [Flavobacterium sp. PL02]MEA9412195.1 hypothetical protein [Flavobacterium sp. PL02]